MNFCIFKSAVFDTNHSLWKKRLNQFEEKKLLVIFMLFCQISLVSDLTFTTLDFGQILLIYIGKVKGFLPIWVDLYRKNQRIFSENRLIYIWKVWVFRSISIQLYRARFLHSFWPPPLLVSIFFEMSKGF